MERLGGVLEASWCVSGASWGVSTAKSESAVPGTQLRLARGDPNIKEEENLQTSTRPPYAGRRHAAGPLRARCGSTARRSRVPATALGLVHFCMDSCGGEGLVSKSRKIVLPLQRVLDFSRFEGRSWHRKSMQHPSKMGTKAACVLRSIFDHF